jgi:hypothetical protein
MKQNIQAVKQQIKAHGGHQTSQMLSRIFDESNQEFGKDFNVNQFFDDLWDRNKMSDERWSRDVDAKPNWNGKGTNNGYNVIPAINPYGFCASFCLTIIPRGFQNIGPTPFSRIYNRLNLSKAI